MKTRILIAALLLLLALILIPWTMAEYRTESAITVTADGVQIPAVPCGAVRYLSVQTLQHAADPVSAVRNRPPRDLAAGGTLRVYLDGAPVSAAGRAIRADGTSEPLDGAADGLRLPADAGVYTVVVCAVHGRDRYYAALPVRCIPSETVFY